MDHSSSRLFNRGCAAVGHLAACAMIIGVTTTARAADTVANTQTPSTDSVADFVTNGAGDLANFYSIGSAIFAAIQILYAEQFPPNPLDQPATLGALKNELGQLGSQINWDLMKLNLDNIDSTMRIATEAAIACQSAGNCDTASNATLGTDNSLSAIAIGNFAGSLWDTYMTRPSTEEVLANGLYQIMVGDSAVYGPWMWGISNRAQKDGNGEVYDWRGALPFYLKWLVERLAFMVAVSKDNSALRSTFGQEISDHISALWNNYDRIRSGITCGYACYQDPNDPVCPFGGPMYKCTPTEFCADIYSGSYASRALGPATCGEFPLSADVSATLPEVDNELKHELYESLPLQQMAHLIGILELYNNPHNHGFLIRTFGTGTPVPLYLNAYGGAGEGVALRVHPDCRSSNTDCTWQYVNGMLISDSPNAGAPLAIMAGTGTSPLTLTTSCTPSNPRCQWYFVHGVWIAQGSGKMALLDGPITGSRVGITSTGDTWSMPNVMFSPNALSSGFAMRAWTTDLSSAPFGAGDAADGGPATLDICVPTNRNCTWTITDSGEILNDFGLSNKLNLGLNAAGGAADPNVSLRVTTACDPGNLDCTWQLSPAQGGGLVSVENYPAPGITYQRYANQDLLYLSTGCSPYCWAVSQGIAITQAGD